MKKIIFNSILISFLLLSGLGSVSGQENYYSYSVGLRYNYQEETLNLVWLNLVRGSVPSRLIQQKISHLAKIISFEEETLYFTQFDIPTIAWAPPSEWFDPETGEQIYFGPEDSGEELPSDITFSLIFPYFSQAKAIEFYDLEDNLLLSVDLSEYQLCKDNLENCENILIQYHQQEIAKLTGTAGSEEEIKNHQDRIVNLQDTKAIKDRIMGVSVEQVEKELKGGVRWQNILIALGTLILIGFAIYFVRKIYFLKKKLI